MFFSFGKKKVDALVIALGNPGEKYLKTRHNAAWLLLDESFPDLDWSFDKYLNSQKAFIVHNEKEILFLRPQTMMNNSGQTLSAARKRFQFDQKNLIVAHDDVDLQLGKIKLSFDRGDAGHNGVASIVSAIGQTFVRMRIGISTKLHDDSLEKRDVLGRFMSTELAELKALSTNFQKIIFKITEDGYEVAMNEFNKKV